MSKIIRPGLKFQIDILNKVEFIESKQYKIFKHSSLKGIVTDIQPSQFQNHLLINKPIVLHELLINTPLYREILPKIDVYTYLKKMINDLKTLKYVYTIHKYSVSISKINEIIFFIPYNDKSNLEIINGQKIKILYVIDTKHNIKYYVINIYDYKGPKSDFYNTEELQ